jgi:hypothetical protein
VKVKIVSDGTTQGTQVVNAETGEPIDGVTFVAWELEAKDGVATVSLELRKIPVEVVGALKA